MKKLLLSILLLSALVSFAQVKEGKVTYELKIDMHRRIPADNAQMLAMVPPFRKSKFELLFADNQSFFKAKEEEQDIADQNQSGGVMIRMGSAEDVTYKNFSNQRYVQQREFMGTNYLVEGPLNLLTWKLEEGSEKILGYNCKKATTKNAQGNDVIVWYTEEISVPSGPDQYSSLPGLILYLDSNKGEFVYTALAVDKKVNAKDIKAPNKGKKVTSEEFAKVRKEATGNNNGFRMVTN